MLLEARIISGTEFLETDFSGQIIWVKIPITFILVEIAGTVANEEQFKERS